MHNGGKETERIAQRIQREISDDILGKRAKLRMAKWHWNFSDRLVRLASVAAVEFLFSASEISSNVRLLCGSSLYTFNSYVKHNVSQISH